jgi:hypothetical protein
VASTSVEAHEGTLANIAANFGEVATTAGIAEIWSKGA